MRLAKNQLKTWNSQQSDIDMFSKLQNTFLQKFFRFNIIDFFYDFMLNIQETSTIKKVNGKGMRLLVNHLFKVEKGFMINEFQQKVHTFYKNKSKSFESGELQHAFKIRYCNWNPVPNFINKNELILFDIKIKAQIQKLEKIPQNLVELVKKEFRNDKKNQDYQIAKRIFQNYDQEFFNIFIVYFGDINFHLVRKEHYEVQQINIFGKKFNLRIFTFFVSKQGLLQKFRSMNKITTLDHINDLVIQFYEIKREKKKSKIKRQKQQSKEINLLKSQSKVQKLYDQYFPYWKYVAGGVGVITALYFATYKIIAPAH